MSKEQKMLQCDQTKDPPDSNNDEGQSDMEDEPCYPLTPNIIVENRFEAFDDAVEVLSLMEDGQTYYTVKDKVDQHKTVKRRNDDDGEMATKSRKTADQEFENAAFVKQKVSTPVEGQSDLRHLASPGNTSECLRKETSQGKVKFVVISSATPMNIFSNPTVTRKLIDNSIFKQHLVGSIEVKGKGKSIRFTIPAEVNIDFSKIKTLAEFSVHVWSPLTSEHTIGVISPVDLGMDLEKEFIPHLQLLDSDINSSHIIDVKRLNRRGVDLELVKIVFEGKTLPRKISWNNLIFNVRPFIHEPIRCFKCQNFGHGANSCNNKIVCPFCQNPHTLAECPKKKNEDFRPRCLHCKLDHLTGSRVCEFFRQASIIENKKRKNEVSYEESRKLYSALNKKTISQVRNNLFGASNVQAEKPYASALVGSTKSINNDLSRDNVAEVQTMNFEDHNKFDVLSNIESEDSDFDFFETPTEKIESRSVGARPKRILRVSSKYKNNSKKKPSNRSQGLSGSVNLPKTVNTQKSKANSRVGFDRPETQNVEGLSKFLNLDFKESVLYKLLLKCFNFYNTPNKTFDDCITFLFELLTFVGQVSESEI